MPNGFYILAWDSCLNFKLLAVCPVMGVEARIQPLDDGLGIKSIACSTNSLFVALGSHDEKIRLVNALTWKIIGEMDCMPSSSTTQTVRMR
jgi:WD40 repeat protein